MFGIENEDDAKDRAKEASWMTRVMEKKSRADGIVRAGNDQGIGRREFHEAVLYACRVYRYRELERNLRESGWRKARREVLRHGALSGEWVGRGRREVLLSRRGLEVRLAGEMRSLSWKELQEFVKAQRL